MRVIWTKDVPTTPGWYWIKYRRRRGIVCCPAEVRMYPEHQLTQVISAHNDIWTAGHHHGWQGLKDPNGWTDKTMRFGPAIEVPK